MNSLRISALILTILTVLLSGCDLLNNFDDNKAYPENSIIGSGNIITIERPFTDFENIDASHAFDITVVQGNEFEVKIHLDDNLLEYLVAEKNGSLIQLGLTGNNSYNNITLRAQITMPDLYWVEMSGASRLHLPELNFHHSLSMRLSGASNVTGNITAGNLDFKLSGASYMNLSGTGDNLTLQGSGASKLNFEDLAVENATITLSGASFSTLNVSGLLSAYLSGASILYYKGNPTIGTIQISGGAIVQRI